MRNALTYNVRPKKQNTARVLRVHSLHRKVEKTYTRRQQCQQALTYEQANESCRLSSHGAASVNNTFFFSSATMTKEHFAWYGLGVGTFFQTIIHLTSEPRWFYPIRNRTQWKKCKDNTHRWKCKCKSITRVWTSIRSQKCRCGGLSLFFDKACSYILFTPERYPQDHNQWIQFPQGLFTPTTTWNWFSMEWTNWHSFPWQFIADVNRPSVTHEFA